MFINRELSQLKDANLFRQTMVLDPAEPGYVIFKGKLLVDLCSNDYLGLSRHPALIEASCRAAVDFGCGARASRLMSGTQKSHERLENAVALLKNSESAMIFGSGYLANAGIIPALCSRHDAVFSDRLNHASIMDGILLSRARLFRYRHNDLCHLEELLNEHRKKFRRAMIITESLFSMDGDIADIAGLIRCRDEHEAMLFIDEAHATGVFGQHGEGIVNHTQAKNIDVITGTFGKALGGYGAYAAISSLMKQYLVNRCRTFIFSTALPATVTEAALAAIEIVRTNSRPGEYLLDLSNKFRKRLMQETGISTCSQSQIIPVPAGSNQRALELQARLMRNGFFCRAIRPPTVPEGTARLRLSLTADHRLEQLEKFVKVTAEFIKNNHLVNADAKDHVTH